MGAALDMVVVLTLACALVNSFAKVGAIPACQSLYFSRILPMFPKQISVTSNPIEFDGIRPPSVNQSVRITTRLQPNTLSIACKCPCMLSTLFSGIMRHKKAPDAV